MSLISSIADFLFPRYCVVCGRRLTTTEQTLCLHCNIDLPRTYLWESPQENILTDRFLGKFTIQKAASFFYFAPKSGSARIVYDFKYHHDKAAAHDIGVMMGREMMPSGFFDGIDGLLPVPLHPNRYRQRGYNQSEVIAEGISEVTGIPVMKNLLARAVDTETQTRLTHLQRDSNMRGAFVLKPKAEFPGSMHMLLIDDVITTGSTMQGCYEALKRIPDISLSVLSVGCVRY